MTQPLASADHRHLYSRAENWPERSSPLCETYLPRPRYDNDLVAWWEWFLWTEYRPGDWRGGTQEPQEFWRQLSTCELLLALCRERPSLRLHHLVVHLFFNARLFEKPKPERMHIFGIENPPPPPPDYTKERRVLRQSLRRLIKMREQLDEDPLSELLFRPSGPRKLPGRFPSPAAQEEATVDPRSTGDKILGDAIKRAERMLKNLGNPVAPLDVLLVGLWGEARVAELRAEEEARLAELPASEQENPKPMPTPPLHRKPRYSGADVNMYLTLIVEFLRKDDQSAFPWADAFAILTHFNPTLLKDIFKPRSTDAVPRAVGSEAIADRVKDFRTPKDDEQRVHIEERIQAAKDWHALQKATNH